MRQGCRFFPICTEVRVFSVFPNFLPCSSIGANARPFKVPPSELTPIRRSPVRMSVAQRVFGVMKMVLWRESVSRIGPGAAANNITSTDIACAHTHTHTHTRASVLQISHVMAGPRRGYRPRPLLANVADLVTLASGLMTSDARTHAHACHMSSLSCH
jgi:hypothetical protein